MVKVYLLNHNVVGQRCGWGEGETRQDAINDALELAKSRGHTDALYNPISGFVEFSAEVRL